MLPAPAPEPFLDVELKGEPVEAVIPVLEAARGPALAQAVVSSFEAETLRWVGLRRPVWPRWLNAEDLSERTVDLAVRAGCRGLSVDWQAVDGARVARARGRR